MNVNLWSNMPIEGEVGDKDGNVTAFEPRLAEGTKVRIDGEHSDLIMRLSGAFGAQIRGGNGDTLIVARGGENTITPGNGQTAVALDGLSGLGNHLTHPTAATTIEVPANLGLQANPNNHGILLEIREPNSNTVKASLEVESATLKDVQRMLVRTSDPSVPAIPFSQDNQITTLRKNIINLQNYPKTFVLTPTSGTNLITGYNPKVHSIIIRADQNPQLHIDPYTPERAINDTSPPGKATRIFLSNQLSSRFESELLLLGVSPEEVKTSLTVDTKHEAGTSYHQDDPDPWIAAHRFSLNGEMSELADAKALTRWKTALAEAEARSRAPADLNQPIALILFPHSPKPNDTQRDPKQQMDITHTDSVNSVEHVNLYPKWQYELNNSPLVDPLVKAADSFVRAEVREELRTGKLTSVPSNAEMAERLDKAMEGAINMSSSGKYWTEATSNFTTKASMDPWAERWLAIFAEKEKNPLVPSKLEAQIREDIKSMQPKHSLEDLPEAHQKIVHHLSEEALAKAHAAATAAHSSKHKTPVTPKHIPKIITGQARE